MAVELITPQTELSSPLMENVYRTLSDFAPLYVQEMNNLADAFKSTMGDEYGPYGWGVFMSGFNFGYEQERTARGYCAPGNELLARYLSNRFPLLEVSRRRGRANKFNSSKSSSPETVGHHWLVLTDSCTANLGLPSKYTVDGAIRQFNPEGPHILFTSDSSYYPGVYAKTLDIQRYSADNPNDYTNWFRYSEDDDLYEQQIQAVSKFFVLAA